MCQDNKCHICHNDLNEYQVNYYDLGPQVEMAGMMFHADCAGEVWAESLGLDLRDEVATWV